MWQALYERVIQFASEGRFATDLGEARASYLKATGELFESDGNFERRMAAFLEWYTLDRPLDEGATPLEHFARAHDTSLGADELAVIACLQRSSTSLFSLGKNHKGGCSIHDCLGEREIFLHEKVLLAGLAENDLFVGRIFCFENESVLSEGATFLPRQARAQIRAAAQPLVMRRGPRSEHSRFITTLVFGANRAERYRHVDARLIFDKLLQNLV